MAELHRSNTVRDPDDNLIVRNTTEYSSCSLRALRSDLLMTFRIKTSGSSRAAPPERLLQSGSSRAAPPERRLQSGGSALQKKSNPSVSGNQRSGLRLQMKDVPILGLPSFPSRFPSRLPLRSVILLCLQHSYRISDLRLRLRRVSRSRERRAGLGSRSAVTVTQGSSLRVSSRGRGSAAALCCGALLRRSAAALCCGRRFMRFTTPSAMC
ncbi:hypothetical protein EYF80_017832 [Liparis tanakae]|uniref:Uncharacterized protein n=1 Tax=Liparis tanakae TaxID=230148 RepID=A0A4Z2I405_9TELE|nr:hypothetical protein EYF80_017832 [Liparis tanakae]